MLAVEVADSILAALVAIMCVFLAGGVGAIGWTVSLLWRTSNQLARMESTQEDHERRLIGLEGHT